jgi:hypothetical protein
MGAIWATYKNWILGIGAVLLVFWFVRKKKTRTYVRRRSVGVARRIYSRARRVTRRRK